MIETLLEQYKEINGINFLSINDLKREDIRQEFKEWLKERYKYGNRYLDFIYEMNNSVLDRTTAEVGKTELDSLVIPFDTTIISPYEFKELEDRERLINSKFMVYEEKPVLYFDRQEQPTLVVLPERRIDTFMTQNPYTPYSIKYWSDLHNSEKFDIVVGVYGSIYDKNIKSNLELLKYIKDKCILSDYKYDLNHDGDVYYGAIASNRKVKTYKKVK